MNIFLFDAFCVLLIAAGLLIAFKEPSPRPADRSRDKVDDDPRIYARRIAGVMLMAFGLALAVIFTTFHYA